MESSKIVAQKNNLLDKIPPGWMFKQLHEISKVIVPMRDKPKKFDGDIPWIRIEDLEGKYVFRSMSNQKVSEQTIKEMNLKPYPIGTVLCSCSGNMGICAITKSMLVSNQTFAGIVPNKEMNSDYLYYLMNFNRPILERMSSGTTIAYLSQEKFESMKLAIPPISEMLKIAFILSTVDELIQKTDQIIQASERLRKGLMQHLLNKGIGHFKFKKSELDEIPDEWEIGKLREHTKKIGSGITPHGGSKVYKKNGIPFIRSQNVHFDGLRLDDVAYISEEIDEEMKNTRTNPGDVLLNITGASIGRCTFIPSYLHRGNVNQHVCIIRPQQEINSQYLAAFLSSEAGQKMVHSSHHGLSREGLTFSNIGSFSITIPKIEEQDKIVRILSSINKLVQIQNQSKISIQKLKKGLMQKLLTGRIRVKV